MSKKKTSYEKSWIIGIDLGTTNCTMAAIAPESSKIEQISIPQIISKGTQGISQSFPSALYFLLDEEVSGGVNALEWNSDRNFVVGIYARERGGEVPSRFVSSSKSWLCHSGIDRRSNILPVEADEGMEMISPLHATAEILRHIKEAWDHTHASDPFEKQQIFVTVPASFDPSARQLVQEAAEIAGYPEPILLEEPQAAFYAWLERHQDDWRKLLKVGDCVLVVDIGGGTTDFSLIEVSQEEGDLVLNRLAVGSHLLLGGDNIDLTLAYFAREKLEKEGHAVDDWQFKALTHACRNAKEKLLAENPQEEVTLTIAGRGRKLIGGSLSTTLTRQEVQNLIVEGFIPLVDPQEHSQVEKRSGIQQIGLPYAQDARISCQLARFLSMTGEGAVADMDKFVMPTAVLFNGGTLKAPALRHRLLELLNHWSKQLGKPSVRELPEPDYDFAVSRGAANYGQARSGNAVRIRGGIGRSYFVGVEDAVPAVPGFAPPLRAICIAPFGMEEGTEQSLKGREFALVLGEQATFRFFSRSTAEMPNGVPPIMGTEVRDWKNTLTELHPIESFLNKSDGDGKTVKVELHSRVTELGVLELWCEAQDQRKWKLEFDLRDQKEPVLQESK